MPQMIAGINPTKWWLDY